MIPQARFALIAPEPFVNERGAIRVHNKAAKDALRDEGLNHWKKRIPQHFRATARAKYGYKERRDGYKAMKLRRYKTRTDLVLTGETREAITRTEPQIRAGGKATNPDGTAGQMKMSVVMRLPFGQEAQAAVAKAIRLGKLKSSHSSGEHRPGVTIEDMKREIAALTIDEAKEIAESFGKGYTKHLLQALRTRPRIRKQYAQAKFNPF